MPTYTAQTRTLTARPRSERLRQTVGSGMVVGGGTGSAFGSYLPASENGNGYDVNHKTSFVQNIRLGNPDTVVGGETVVNGIDIEFDRATGAVHIKGGLYADWVSAMGANDSSSGSGGGGLDESALWELLNGTSTPEYTGSKIISSSYLPSIALSSTYGTLPVDRGGTGATTAADALENLIGSSSIGGNYPIYWTGSSFSQLTGTLSNNISGKVNGCTISSTVNSGTANYLVYYSGANAIGGASANQSYYVGGPLHLLADQYNGLNGYALNCHNSDIVGVNSILTQDTAESFGECIGFYRSASTWDCLTANSGTFYFGSNKTYGAALAGDANIRCGQIGATHIVSIANGTYGSRLHIANNTVDTYFELWRDVANQMSWGYCDASSHYKYITLLSNGNVGISTNSPSYKLSVSGDIGAGGSIGLTQTSGAGDGIALYGGPASNPAYGLMFASTATYGKFGDLTGDWATYFTMDTTWGSKRGWAFRVKNTSTIVASLSTDGNFCAKGGVTALVATSSDRRLKKDIKPFNAMEIVDKLVPVKFRWNKHAQKYNCNFNNGVNYGLIAQDCDGIIDDMVFDLPDGSGYKGVRYEKLIPVLLQAIKELKLMVKELKGE